MEPVRNWPAPARLYLYLTAPLIAILVSIAWPSVRDNFDDAYYYCLDPDREVSEPRQVSDDYRAGLLVQGSPNGVFQRHSTLEEIAKWCARGGALDLARWVCEGFDERLDDGTSLFRVAYTDLESGERSLRDGSARDLRYDKPFWAGNSLLGNIYDDASAQARNWDSSSSQPPCEGNR